MMEKVQVLWAAAGKKKTRSRGRLTQGSSAKKQTENQQKSVFGKLKN